MNSKQSCSAAELAEHWRAIDSHMRAVYGCSFQEYEDKLCKRVCEQVFKLAYELGRAKGRSEGRRAAKGMKEAKKNGFIGRGASIAHDALR
jgi:hypothetical protein